MIQVWKFNEFRWNVGGHRMVGNCNAYGVKMGCTL